VPREEVRKAFQDQAAALAATLRAFTPLETHKSTIGTGREQTVINALQANFGGLSLTRGQIHAPAAEPSSEWDVIIADAASGPLAGMQGAYPIESVLAVVSIKSRLDGAAIDDCGRAAGQLRAMDIVDVPGALRPAVFALALEGLTVPNLRDRLEDAYAKYGPGSAIDGLIILERRIALVRDGSYVVSDDDDAYGRWLAAIDRVLRTTPRRSPVLSSYLFGTDSEPEDEPPSGPARPSPSPSPAPSGSGLTMQACATRPVDADLRSSRMMGRLGGELATGPSRTAFEEALESLDSLAALARSATGRLLDVVGRALTAFNRDAEAADALSRYAEEPDADRPRALAAASASWRVAGEVDRADKVLADAALESANHPAVRLQQISLMEDVAEKLRALDSIGTLGESVDRAGWALLRATALHELDRDEEGIDDLRAALAERWSPALAERLGIALTNRVSAGLVRDSNAVAYLQEAAGTFDELSRELLVLGRRDIALQIDARLGGLLLRLERRDLLDDLARWWLAHLDKTTAEARIALANVLVDADEYELASQIVPDDLGTGPEGVYLGARLVLAQSDREPGEERTAVLALDVLLADADARGIDPRAIASARAEAAIEGAAEWSDAAEAVLADDEPFYLAMLKSNYVLRNEDAQAADAMLLPFADTPEGIRALIDLAVRSERWERVVSLIEDGLREHAPPVERVRLADALERLGKLDEAEAAWREVAKSPDTSPYFQDRAWFRLAKLLARRQSWERLAEATQQWQRARPDNGRAVWAAVEALGRLGRANEAWELLAGAAIRPETEGERWLAASIAARALPVADALTHVAALSDAVDRTDERLEAMLIAIASRVGETELTAELDRRIRQTFEDFPERFPDSAIVQTVPAPSTEDDWAEFADRYVTTRRDAAQEMATQVQRGQSPLAVFATLGGTPLSVWIDSDILPLVAPVTDIREQERAAARQALAGTAVWDSSVLAVLSLLDESVANTIATALPASITARAVGDEVRGLHELVAERDPIHSPGTLTVDDGRPVLQLRTAEHHARFTARCSRVEDLARRLSLHDPGVATEGEVAEALREGDLHGSAASWLGAVLLASQRGVPLFCDDRYLRAWAHRLGLRTFGTVALLDALAECGQLADEDLSEALWTLRAAGGQHLPASTTDLLARIAADHLQPTAATVGLLNDPYGWVAEVDAQFHLWHAAMVEVHRAAPGELGNWVALLVQSAARANHQPRSTTAALLVATGLTESDAPSGYIRALLVALKHINLERFAVGDPFAAALAHIHRMAEMQYPGQEMLWVYRAMSRAPLPYQLRVLSSGLL
jgi:hypothetical protein